MADVDFFVDVMVSGAILGVGLTDSPAEVARVLGGDFVEDRERLRLRRDYGLVEVFWARRSGSEGWQPDGFTVQAHRLASITVAETFVHRYGAFGRRLRFARLNAELDRLGYHLQEITKPVDAGYRRFWLAESRTSLVVTTSASAQVDVGDVWSISAPHPPEAVAADRLSGQRHTVRDGLSHLLRLNEHQRERWLDRRQPAQQDRANWWLYLLLVIDDQLHNQPGQQTQWAGLKFWLLRQGCDRAVFTQAETADRLAYSRLRLRRAGVDSAVLPPADEVVRACLDAIPAGLYEVAVLDDRRDLRHLDMTQMRQSRQARTLVSAAQWHLDDVQDPHLAARLREWIDIKPHLV
ncbi:hypothetical protein [Kribbella sp. NPDC003557]|uniref:hypothetical protein n=1 Tax=Kribbella sp. NPDC003557 TaxID=3154449 RepID=UPI0033BF0005